MEKTTFYRTLCTVGLTAVAAVCGGNASAQVSAYPQGTGSLRVCAHLGGGVPPANGSDGGQADGAQRPVKSRFFHNLSCLGILKSTFFSGYALAAPPRFSVSPLQRSGTPCAGYRRTNGRHSKFQVKIAGKPAVCFRKVSLPVFDAQRLADDLFACRTVQR